jgi:hypothetical protein
VEALQAGVETRIAELDRRIGDQTEALGELRTELDGMADVRSELEEQLETSARENATMVAEARLGRDQVIAFATAEAGRAALLQELERRSARVERFLQRLGDIAEDTALDLGVGTPGALPITPAPAPASATPTPTPAAIETPMPTGTPAPVDTPAPTATRTATATP